MKQLAHATLGYATAAIAASETVSRVAVDVSNFLVNEDEDAPVPTTLRNAARLLERAGVDGKALRTMDAADLNEVGLSGSLTKRVLYARDTAPLPSAADASVNPFE